jgi:hypothetical protein
MGKQFIILFISVVLSSLILSGCGSSVGIYEPSIGSGGTIVGRVLGNVSGGYSGYTAIAGAYVVAERNDGSFLRRSVLTDYNGNYRFEGLPLGSWRFGYEAYGYGTVSIDNSGILGYSEAGSTYSLPDVHLNAVSASGQGIVRIILIKNGTGDPIANASVTVGPSSGITSYYGEVILNVPVRIDSMTGYPVPERVLVSGNGIDGSTVNPLYITPIAHNTVYATLFVNAYGTEAAGLIQSSQYNSLYLDGLKFSSISITSAEVSSLYLEPYINTYTGDFSVTIPSNTPYVYLRFSSPYFNTQEVGPIFTGSGGGVVYLSSPVTLVPLVRNVQGYVSDSYGSPVTSSNGSMTISLGKSADYLNSSFLFSNVPVGLDLVINTWVFNGRNESATNSIQVPAGYSPFTLPAIITSPY